MDLQQQIDELRGNHEELVRTINALSVDVNNTATDITNRVNGIDDKVKSVIPLLDEKMDRLVSGNADIGLNVEVDYFRRWSKYFIVGNICFVMFEMVLLGGSTSTENVKLVNLPKPISSSMYGQQYIWLSAINGTTTNSPQAGALSFYEGNNSILYKLPGSTGANRYGLPMTASALRNNMTISGTFYYEIAK